MRLAIDVREPCRPKKAGKGQWTYGFVHELIAREIPLVLYTDTPVPSEWQSPGIRQMLISSRGFPWHWQVSTSLRQSSGIDLYVSPTSYIVPALLGKKFPHVPIVHDLIAFRRELHDRKAQAIERLTLRRTVRTARRICTISESTKIDLLAKYPSLDPRSITAIFAGPMREHPSVNISDGKTILCVATLCPRKNQMRLIRAYASLPAHLRSQFRLRLVGARGWHDSEIIRLARQTPGVSWTQYVDDGEYGRLLDTCHVLALPSLYEGFGMQVLDAFQRGIPVLTSSRGSLAEVAGDAACIVDPNDVKSIAKGLERILTDEGLRGKLRQRGPLQAAQFSWKWTVDLFLAAIQGL